MDGEKRIVITEKGSREFYKEVVNVTVQYGRLLRNPRAKLKDQFKEFRSYAVLCAVFLVILIAENVFLESSTFTWALIVMLAILCIACIFMLSAYNKRLNAMLSDSERAELVLDDTGVELIKESTTLKLSWDNIAFARVFDESVCFLLNNQAGALIAVNKKYLDEISPYIKSEIIGI